MPEPQPQSLQAMPLSHADLLLALRNIAGLDVNLGLLRTSNNVDFYASMLRKFVVSQQDAAERIRQALQTQDTGTAERHAHTLKSVAGNLGASTLQDAADALESVLCKRLNAPEIQTEFLAVEQLLMELVRDLKASPALVEVRLAARMQDLTEVERTSAREVAGDIKQCLRQDDAGASELWNIHAFVLRALYPNAAAIESAIGNFEFEIALELMDHSA